MIEYWSINDIRKQIIERSKNGKLIFFIANDEEDINWRYTIEDIKGNQVTLMMWYGSEKDEIVYTHIETFNEHFKRVT